MFSADEKPMYPILCVSCGDYYIGYREEDTYKHCQSCIIAKKKEICDNDEHNKNKFDGTGKDRL